MARAGRTWDRVLFRRATAQVELDKNITPYALRHSSIDHQLLAAVPTRVVAAHHDTSVAMLEKTYSRHIIGDPSDAITRRALLDLASCRQGPTWCRSGGNRDHVHRIHRHTIGGGPSRACRLAFADIDWPAVRLELEQAGRDFWAMRANRRRRQPKAERVRLRRALQHLRQLEHVPKSKSRSNIPLSGWSGLENRLAIYEASSVSP